MIQQHEKKKRNLIAMNHIFSFYEDFKFKLQFIHLI